MSFSPSQKPTRRGAPNIGGRPHQNNTKRVMAEDTAPPHQASGSMSQHLGQKKVKIEPSEVDENNLNPLHHRSAKRMSSRRRTRSSTALEEAAEKNGEQGHGHAATATPASSMASRNAPNRTSNELLDEELTDDAAMDEEDDEEEGEDEEGEEGKGGEADEEEVFENCLSLSEGHDGFRFDPTKHRKKVIGVYTEKGGVGKTNFILGSLASSTFSKILVIDTDPQNNVINGFLPPAFVAQYKGEFQSCMEFMNSGKLENTFKVTTGTSVTKAELSQGITPLQTDIEVVLGDHFSSKQLDLMRNEEDDEFPMHTKRYIKQIRDKLVDYDVILIDFNPKMSHMNKALLVACDEVITLATGDIHSHYALSSLLEVRDEQTKRFKIKPKEQPLAPGDDIDVEPQRFVISAVPSIIERIKGNRNNKENTGIRTQHATFVDQVFLLVKEKNLPDFKYRGFIGMSKKMYGRCAVRLFENHNNAKLPEEARVMRSDVKRVLVHCILNTEEPRSDFKYKFPWKVACTKSDSISVREEVKQIISERRASPNGDDGQKAGDIFIYRDIFDSFKLSRKEIVSKKRKSKNSKEWEFFKSFHTTDTIAESVKRKLLDYFSSHTCTTKDTILLLKDTRGKLFEQFLKDLEELRVAENFIIGP